MIKYYALERWGWECECGQFNEIDDDPTYLDELDCEDCGKVYTEFEEE